MSRALNFFFAFFNARRASTSSRHWQIDSFGYAVYATDFSAHLAIRQEGDGYIYIFFSNVIQFLLTQLSTVSSPVRVFMGRQ